ncbi:hypothetical protein V2J09_004448 [Rumex salicifolius]
MKARASTISPSSPPRLWIPIGTVTDASPPPHAPAQSRACSPPLLTNFFFFSVAESTDDDEEIGPSLAFSVGGEGSGFATLARGGADVGFGQTAMVDCGTFPVMTGGGDAVGNTANNRAASSQKPDLW